jgi:hypothetical protein
MVKEKNGYGYCKTNTYTTNSEGQQMGHRSVLLFFIATQFIIAIASIIVVLTENGGCLVKDNFLNFRVS